MDVGNILAWIISIGLIIFIVFMFITGKVSRNKVHIICCGGVCEQVTEVRYNNEFIKDQVYFGNNNIKWVNISEIEEAENENI